MYVHTYIGVCVCGGCACTRACVCVYSTYMYLYNIMSLKLQWLGGRGQEAQYSTRRSFEVSVSITDIH